MKIIMVIINTKILKCDKALLFKNNIINNKMSSYKITNNIWTLLQQIEMSPSKFSEKISNFEINSHQTLECTIGSE